MTNSSIEMADLSETILQFGAGRFLRAFFDRFIQHANDAGQKVGRVVVVQSTPGPRADRLNQQPDGYHVLVRGYQDGELVDRVECVRSISRALIADSQWDDVLNVARSPHLRWIVSNTTESGYKLDPADKTPGRPPRSFPAKLTQVLWTRFEAKAGPVVLLPCELFEQNATKLCDLVRGQARDWGLSADFDRWLTQECWWLNNLVDCIITDGPADHPLAVVDKLLVCAEPYALCAIQRPSRGAPPLFTDPAIQVVDDLAPYYLRKVRILNGTHSAMVGKFLSAGYATVQDVLRDGKAARWVRELIYEEIVPTLAFRLDGVSRFADDTLDRFRSPFLAHKLSDIAAYHADKLRVRLQPTREEYERLFGKSPPRLTEAMAGKVPG